MPQLYLVKTTFKAGGVVFLAGDLVEEQDLAGIRLVKIRLNEGKLIPLPEEGQVLDTMTLFFEQRYGIDLKARIADRASKGSDSAETKDPDVNVIPPTGTPEAPPVKPVVPPKAILPTKPQPLSKSPVTNTVKK